MINENYRRTHIQSPPKNILVADVDYKKALRLAAVVKRLEYNVFVATSAADITRLTSGLIPNLILLEIGMPQASSEALRTNKTLSMTKIITVAEKDKLTELEGSLKKGANGYLVRPIGATALYRTIHGQIEPHPRQAPRLKVIFKVNITSGNTARATFATAMSEQGIFVRTVKPLEVGTKVKLALDLPSARPIAVDGEVIYSIPEDTEKLAEPGMGIKFIDIAKDLQEGLRRFIDEQITGESGYEYL